MKVKQLAVYLEDRPGRLADISHAMAENAINIRALALADRPEGGILRLVVNDTGKAKKTLETAGFRVELTELLVVEVPDRPGALDCILQAVKKAGLNVEYMYAFTRRSGQSGMLLFRFSDQEAAAVILRKSGCRLISDDELHAR